MDLIVVIYSNGVVQSTYDDGVPADIYSGKLSILKKIKFDRDIRNKKNLPKLEQLYNVFYYFSSDPLSKTIIEVDNKYINSLINYLDVVDNVDNINIEQIPQIPQNDSFTQDLPY